MSASRSPGTEDDGDVDFRVLTGHGRAGVQVLECPGADRLVRLAKFLRRPGGRALSPESLEGRGPMRVDLFVEGDLIDEVLFIDRPAESRSELHLHGAPVLLRRLGSAWREIPPTEPEDLFEGLLQRAETDAQLGLAVEQLSMRQGELGQSSERRASERGSDWRSIAESGSASECRRLEVALAAAEALLEPLDLALVGRQNAGKSTLFNRLLMLERNLTGATPGLTRDAVTEPIDLCGYPVRLVDTAGFGLEQGVLDALAQARTEEVLGRAASVLVVATDEGFRGDDERRAAGSLFVVRSKSDLERGGAWPHGIDPLPVDARDPRDAADLRRVFGERLREVRGLPEVGPDGLGIGLPRTREAMDECRCILRRDGISGQA